MAHERDEKFELEEEGEYHFSDDQLDYEIEPETVKDETETEATATVKQGFFSRISKYRRMLIGIVVFFVLIFIVYEILTPTPSIPSTEFSQTKTPEHSAAVLQETAPVSKAPTESPAPITAASPVQTSPQEVAQPPAPIQQPTQTPPGPSIIPVEQKVASSPSVMPADPTPQLTTQNGQMPQSQASMDVQAIQAAQAAQAAMSAPAPTNPPPPALPNDEVIAAQKALSDRLSVLEEQNAKLLSLMQAQVAQKTDESDSNAKAIGDRIVSLNKKLANMEASLNKMGHLLQERKVPVMAPPPPAPAVVTQVVQTRSVEPKMIYAVQAIIPGRAWLKSELGDIVTVTEGDILKDYGKIRKIDPYDGIVEIDTGSRIIALSYGQGGD